MATYEVLCAQLDRYADLENDVDKLAAFSTRRDSVDFAGRIVRNESGEAVFSFGKHRDRSVVEVFKKEPSYYTWIMEGDFPAYTKAVCTKIYNESKLSQNPNIIFKR